MKPLLAQIQELLERIYDIRTAHDVFDFLITDQRLVRLLEGGEQVREVREKLLVAEAGGGLDVSLYLDAEMLARLGQQDPLECLHDENLDDFWTVLEGISHFIYLAWNAHHDKSVTLLELEMQAEVDKYVTTLYLLRHQGYTRRPAELHYWLFDKPILDPQLEGECLHRYRDANRYAGKYCHALQQRYPRPLSGAGLTRELRRFYRLNQAGKIRHIDAPVFA